VFFDHMGPAEFAAGEGINVRPHPHIGLATVTYLLEGSILHRDSLGNVQEIFPGDVNWMTAGRGIVHSERETLEVRANPHRANGFQVWLALPPDQEQIEPAFYHFGRNALPHIMREGLMMRLVAGSAFGAVSPVRTFSPMFYIDVVATTGAVVERPHARMETAVYVQCGNVRIGGNLFGAGSFVVLEDRDDVMDVEESGRLMLLGGEPFDRQPHLEWNFVSFDRARIEQAKKRWREGGFPEVPGDRDEFIPLPADAGENKGG
jgi:redox-sensitive bicupin YhaK (pirin superfamily)